MNDPNDPSLSISPNDREQWLVTASTEHIAGTDYSLWKTSTPRPVKLPRFSAAFSLGVPLLLLGLVAAARYVIDQSLIGVNTSFQGFALISGVLLYGSMAWAILQTKRSPALDPAAADSPPKSVPSHAIAARASLGRRGRTIGWMWFDKDEICFRGTDFDFRLKRADILSKRQGLKLLGSEDGMVLNRPADISAHQLWLYPGYIANGRFFGKRALWKDLEAEASLWEQASPADTPSLFPPIRPVAHEPFRLPLSGWITPPLYMGALCLFAGLLLPAPEGVHRSPIALAFVGVILGLAWLLALWSDNLPSDSLDREVEKVLGR